MAAQHKLTRVFVHAFMDGRDTLPTSGLGLPPGAQRKFQEYDVGLLSSVSGRYYAMDRDLRWEKETAGLRRHGHRTPRRRNLRRPHRPRPRTLQQRHHRRVHPALHLHQPHRRPSRRPHPRPRRSHQLQLPRRPRPPDHPRPHPPLRPHRTTPSAARATNSPKPPNSTPQSRSSKSPPTSTTSA